MVADAIRRLVDVFVSVVGMVVLSPVLAVAAIAVKLGSPGPVIYRAERIGRGARPFRLYKFRSMIVSSGRDGPAITASEDPRITRTGRFLRRTKLDELPQLFNVIKGDMSLVGPRPEDPCYLDLYTASQLRVLQVRPGLTSPASLVYRHESALLKGEHWERRYVQEILPHKLAIELEYLANRGLLADLRVVARTLVALATDLRRSGQRRDRNPGSGDPSHRAGDEEPGSGLASD
jgi:lipopolysaccharide/colanic/teichoic acid biosynthesis glycosyltransferase